MAFRSLDGPALQELVPVNNTTPLLIKAGASPLNNRQVITLQPKDGKIYVLFVDDGAVPNAATVIAKGFLIWKNQIETFEAGHTQAVYMLSFAGTVNVIVAERS
jgi:hypothetical protein